MRESRIIILDEKRTTLRGKTSEEVVKENELFLTQLTEHTPMSQKDDDVKEAIRDYSSLRKITEPNEDARVSKESLGASMKISTTKKSVSLKFGAIGIGQAGGRMAEVFYNFGYDACAINTAKQDLEFLKIPEQKRLLLEYTLSGAGKDIEVGQAAIEANLDIVRDFLVETVADCDVYVLTTSLSGGSGSGGITTLVELVAELGKPIAVMCSLPGSFDDSQSKYNTIQTLSRLADLSTKGIISSLVIIDNGKIENSYPNLSQAAFWDTANRSTIEPLHLFNSVTAMPSKFEVMDASDLIRAFLESGNCSLFCSITVSREEYESDETGLLSAMIGSMPTALPSDDFNLKEAQAVGVLITAREEVLDNIPYSNIAYIFKYIAEEYDSAGTFKGVYALPSDDDHINISLVFSGMGLPSTRIDALKSDAGKHIAKIEAKKKQSLAGMALANGKGPATRADSMLQKVKQRSSPMGKLIGARNNGNDRKR